MSVFWDFSLSGVMEMVRVWEGLAVPRVDANEECGDDDWVGGRDCSMRVSAAVRKVEGEWFGVTC